jgi:hypothetical protein
MNTSRFISARATAAFAVCAGLAAAMLTQASAQQPVTPFTLPPEQIAERATKARDVTVAYKEKLREGINKALKDGGTRGAIGACNTLAPGLNSKFSDESTFEVARTSNKVRNPENAPDAWEAKGLEALAAEIARGTDPKKLELYEITTTPEGQHLFRYMRPIMMGEECLMCHGSAIAQDIKLEIAHYYPEDKATGFNLGEMRGAFSLVQQLD